MLARRKRPQIIADRAIMEGQTFNLNTTSALLESLLLLNRCIMPIDLPAFFPPSLRAFAGADAATLMRRVSSLKHVFCIHICTFFFSWFSHAVSVVSLFLCSSFLSNEKKFCSLLFFSTLRETNSRVLFSPWMTGFLSWQRYNIMHTWQGSQDKCAWQHSTKEQRKLRTPA